MNEAEPIQIDLRAVLNRTHENKWVALTPDYSHVVAASENLVELDKAVAGKDVIFHRVLPSDVIFAPHVA